MNACTIVARNYLPYARVVARSFLDYHADERFFALVVDDEDDELDTTDEPFEAVRPLDLGLTRPEYHHMAMIYDVTEFSTALKPFLLRRLVGLHGFPMTYLDPDIWVHERLDALDTLASCAPIVLTPHRTEPIPDDGRTPTEGDILAAGGFNLGCITVGPGSGKFLDWWAGRLRRDALRDVENDLFTDQRWIDLVPAYFRHRVLPDPGYNVAYWNLDCRKLSSIGDRYEVDGKPLRFFHFSGFDPDRPTIMTRHHRGAPRVEVTDDEALERLCRAYSERAIAAGFGQNGHSYRYAHLPAGPAVDPVMRRLHRRALIAADRSLAPPPPDPFEPGASGEYVAWLKEPVAGSRDVSRYLAEVRRCRPDVSASFPHVPGTDSTAFLRWARADGRARCAIPDVLLPPATQLGGVSDELPLGVNVIGYLRAEAGVGEASRAMVAGIEAAGIAVATVPYHRTASRQAHPLEREGSEPAVYDVDLLCVNADALGGLIDAIGNRVVAGRHTIGLWHWEVEQFPEKMWPAFALVDEVWVASEFSRAAVAKVAPCPVFRVPMPVLDRPVADIDIRAKLGLPPGFVFLFMFDALSGFARKNPFGVIEAFTKAFPFDEGVHLVVKTINAPLRPDEAENLRRFADGRRGVLIYEGYLSAAENRALTAQCDAYVSLHRSEGFGFTIAEAMGLSKPVIATAYSGNLEFMRPDNSLLVPYDLVPIGPGNAPYPPEASWAEPDVEHAARMMRSVVENPEESRKMGARARHDIIERHSPDACADLISERLSAVRTCRRLVPRVDPLALTNGSARMRPVAGALLRATRGVVAALRDPPERMRGPATMARRTFRRPYRYVWSVANPSRVQARRI